MIRYIISFILLIVLCAGDSYAESRYTSKHFVLFAPKNYTPMLEKVYNRIARNFSISTGLKITVHVYPNRKAYLDAGHSGRTLGHAIVNYKEIYTYMHANTTGTLAHEVAHVLEYYKTARTTEKVARKYERQYNKKSQQLNRATSYRSNKPTRTAPHKPKRSGMNFPEFKL